MSDNVQVIIHNGVYFIDKEWSGIPTLYFLTDGICQTTWADEPSSVFVRVADCLAWHKRALLHKSGNERCRWEKHIRILEKILGGDVELEGSD